MSEKAPARRSAPLTSTSSRVIAVMSMIHGVASVGSSPRRRRTELRRLQHDRLDRVGHILAAIGDTLQRLVDLLPLEQLDWIGLLLEECSNAPLEQFVGAVLVSVHFDRIYGEPPVEAPQTPNHPLGCRDGVHDDAGHGTTLGRRRRDPVDQQCRCRRVDIVEHVIELLVAWVIFFLPAYWD